MQQEALFAFALPLTYSPCAHLIRGALLIDFCHVGCVLTEVKTKMKARKLSENRLTRGASVRCHAVINLIHKPRQISPLKGGTIKVEGETQEGNCKTKKILLKDDNLFL